MKKSLFINRKTYLATDEIEHNLRATELPNYNQTRNGES